MPKKPDQPKSDSIFELSRKDIEIVDPDDPSKKILQLLNEEPRENEEEDLEDYLEEEEAESPDSPEEKITQENPLVAARNARQPVSTYQSYDGLKHRIESPAAPRTEDFQQVLVIYENNQFEFEQVLQKPRINIGRSSNNDVVLSKKSVSRKHIMLSRDEADYFVTDLSSNGSLLNGQVFKYEKLKSQDIIRVGMYKMVYLEGSPEDIADQKAQIDLLSDTDLGVSPVSDAPVLAKPEKKDLKKRSKVIEDLLNDKGTFPGTERVTSGNRMKNILIITLGALCVILISLIAFKLLSNRNRLNIDENYAKKSVKSLLDKGLKALGENKLMPAKGYFEEVLRIEPENDDATKYLLDILKKLNTKGVLATKDFDPDLDIDILPKIDDKAGKKPKKEPEKAVILKEFEIIAARLVKHLTDPKNLTAAKSKVTELIALFSEKETSQEKPLKAPVKTGQIPAVTPPRGEPKETVSREMFLKFFNLAKQFYDNREINMAILYFNRAYEVGQKVNIEVRYHQEIYSMLADLYYLKGLTAYRHNQGTKAVTYLNIALKYNNQHLLSNKLKNIIELQKK